MDRSPYSNPEPDRKIRTVKASHRAVYETFDWAENFFFAILAVILVFTFLFRVVTVVGTSMTNTLQEGDYLVISNLGEPVKTGDIIVVKSEALNEPLIKRVIATGGQWVDIDFDTWSVYVGDTPDTMEKLDEPYVLYHEGVPMRYEYTKENYPMQIEEGYVFVLGDNRNGSMDSRDPAVGAIEEHLVFGRVLLRLFPISAFGTV